MDLIKIITGSWFPRTKLHLKEYHNFIKNGVTHLDLDTEKIKEIRNNINPRNVEYVGGRFDRVSAQLDDVYVSYYEDGLLKIELEITDLKNDLIKIEEFYKNSFVPITSELFSQGMPLLSFMVPTISKRPVIILAKNGTDTDARKLCAELNDEVHYIARHTARTVYYSSQYIIIMDESSGIGITNYVIESLILSREYERRLRDYLELHRLLWDQIGKIQNKTSIPSYELPAIRDQLLNHRRDITIIRTRIKQMLAYLKERQQQIDDLNLIEALRAVEAYRFEKLIGSTYYITKSWDMLKEYLDSTVEITGFFYQENLQKEINIQQFIFLIGAIAGVISLGTVGGAIINGASFEDGAINATLKAFQPMSLLYFGGIALASSILFFFGIKPVISIVNRIKPSSLIGKINEDKQKEKK